VVEAEHCLLRIGPGDGMPAVATAHDLLRGLREDLVAADAKIIIASGLHEYLDDIQKRLEAIHEAIHAAYIDYGHEAATQSQSQS
jgi:uncharacterized alpha-E superfamily protein